MATQHLGNTFDMHLASSDLVFPHGDNEIAVCESLFSQPLARMWLHSEVVAVDGKKASRTAGNDVTLAEVLAEGFSPAAVRYWLLSQHYRRPLEYGREQLALAAKAVERLNDFVGRALFATPGEPVEEFNDLLHRTRNLYVEAMDNDLGLPKAQGHLFAMIKQVNRWLNEGRLDRGQLDFLITFMRKADQVLGVMDFDRAETEPAVDKLLGRREAARASGDFAEADRLRGELAALGVELTDTPEGTRWRRSAGPADENTGN